MDKNIKRAVMLVNINSVTYRQKVEPNNPSGWQKKDNNNIDKWKKYFHNSGCEVLEVIYE